MGVWQHLSRRLIFVSVALFCSALGANIVALLCFLLIRPFSRALYRRLVAQYVACMWIDAMSLLLPGANIHITGDSDMPDGVTTGIVVANHQHEGDWWFMLMVARYLGLHGNVKILVKEQLKALPLLGWILQLAEYPCIAETWSKCRTDLLSLLRSFTADAFPVLLFQFPEGDRIDSNIRQQSMSFAQKERRPQLLHVVLPRTTGFNTCIEALRICHPVVYDMTIAYPGYTGQMPSAVSSNLDRFLNFVNGDGPRDVHIRIKRYCMEEVVGDPHWLDNRWAEKDRILAHFGRTGQFPLQMNGRPGRGVGHSQTGGSGFVRAFNSKSFKAETSALALIRLCLTPLTLPFLVLLSCPVISLYLFVTTLRNWLFPDPPLNCTNTMPRVSSRGETNSLGAGETPQAPATPFLPQTPFTSPLIGSFDLVPPPRRTSPTNPANPADPSHSQGLNSATHKRIRTFDMPASERPPTQAPLHKAHSNQQLGPSSTGKHYMDGPSSGGPGAVVGALGPVLAVGLKSRSTEDMATTSSTSLGLGLGLDDKHWGAAVGAARGAQGDDEEEEAVGLTVLELVQDGAAEHEGSTGGSGSSSGDDTELGLGLEPSPRHQHHDEAGEDEEEEQSPASASAYPSALPLPTRHLQQPPALDTKKLQ